VKDTALELKRRLIKAVQKKRPGSRRERGMLFSGGLDSVILAGACPRVKAITVNLSSGGDDVRYAHLAASVLKMEHHRRTVKIEEAIDAIPEVIRILGSFDPAIPNDIVVYFGLKKAKELGLREIMTGDGSDELLAGYSFMQDMDALDEYIKRIASSLYFSSNELGAFFGMEINQPYMDDEVVDFCLNIPKELKIKKDADKVWGKWILRKAFAGTLPDELIWQTKRPLEYGSGMTGLREIIESRVPDEEFREAVNSTPVNFINKEHFYYYKIYTDVIGAIPGPEGEEKKCPACGAGIKRDAYHCRVCGYCKKAE